MADTTAAEFWFLWDTLDDFGRHRAGLMLHLARADRMDLAEALAGIECERLEIEMDDFDEAFWTRVFACLPVEERLAWGGVMYHALAQGDPGAVEEIEALARRRVAN